MSDIRERIAKALLDEGAGPGNSIHSWRCEHPDRYGPCSCVDEVAAEIVATLGPLYTEADMQAAFVAGWKAHFDRAGRTLQWLLHVWLERLRAGVGS